MVHLNLDKKYVDKNLEKMNKEAIEEFGEEEGKNCYLFDDGEVGRIEEILEEENKIIVVCETSKIGYINMEVELNTDDLLDLITLAVKKLNKFKTILEGLKVELEKISQEQDKIKEK